MIRYIANSNTVFTRSDGKRVFRTITYPPIALSNLDTYIFSGDSTYLDSLADRYYKDSSLWWIIAQANAVKGTLKAPTGMQLRIPGDVATILSNFNSINQ